MAARCTTVNSVVTVIFLRKGCHHRQNFGLAALLDPVSAALSRAGVVALADHLDLVDAHFQRGSFPAVPVLPLAQIDFAGYCDLRPFGQILREVFRHDRRTACTSSRSCFLVAVADVGDREFEYLSACRQIPGFCVSPKAPCEAPNIQAHDPGAPARLPLCCLRPAAVMLLDGVLLLRRQIRQCQAEYILTPSDDAASPARTDPRIRPASRRGRNRRRHRLHHYTPSSWRAWRSGPS